MAKRLILAEPPSFPFYQEDDQRILGALLRGVRRRLANVRFMDDGRPVDNGFVNIAFGVDEIVVVFALRGNNYLVPVDSDAGFKNLSSLNVCRT